MNSDDRIRAAFSDLERRARRDIDARASLARVKGVRPSRRPVFALAAAGVIALAIGGFAFLGLFSGAPNPNDVVSPPSTVATTVAEFSDEPLPTSFSSPARPGAPFIVSISVNGSSAGYWGRPELLAATDQIDSAFPDGSGGIVYLTGSDLVWLTASGNSRPLASGVDALAGVYTDGDGEAAVYVTSGNGTVLIATTLTADPGDRHDYVYHIDWVDGRVLDLDVDGSNLVALVERSGCRRVLIERDFASNGATATIDRGTCAAQQDGFPRAVAISGSSVAVAESASAGEIEFTFDDVAVYDLDGVEVARHRIDTYLDIEVTDIDLAGDKALVAGEFLWVVDVNAGTVVEVNDPFRTGLSVARASWTSDPWTLSDQVIAFRVTGVAANDTLNVRVSPDAGSEVTARLAPNYAAIGDTGETAIAPDGGKWRRVTLLDPVRLQGLQEPLGGGSPAGWVNEAFLESLPEGLPVSSADVPLCQGSSVADSTGSGETPDHVYSVWMGNVGGCLRLVISLGTGFDSSFPNYDGITTDPRPITGVPQYRLTQTDGEVTVNFPGLTKAWQFGVDRDSAFVVRESDGSLSVTVLTSSNSVIATPLPGRVVIDMLGASPAPAVNLVAVAPLQASPDGELIVNGVARPFEATLGIELRDSSGNPVEATFEGSNFLGTVVDSRYAVMTTDYIEAWGRFGFKMSGLVPGDYTLFLSSGAEAEPSGNEVSFTVPTG